MAGPEEQPRYKRLTQIALALSAEKDIMKLLEMILTEARDVTTADAGTLYVLDKDRLYLHFSVMQNNTLDAVTDWQEKVRAYPAIPLYFGSRPNYANVSSYVAITGNAVHIPNVYEAEEFDFTGPREFDEATGYRTKSMLVVPMINHENEVIGVLQLLNAKEPQSGEAVGFSAENSEVVKALASVASVVLDNTELVEDLSDELQKIRELQAAEKELSQKIREAYLEIEEKNKSLTQALRKVRVTRVSIMVFLVLCLAVGGGVFAWSKINFKRFHWDRSTGAGSAKDGAYETYIVTPKPVSSSISLAGKVEPLMEVSVVSPFSGKVADKFFYYGEKVSRGDLLVSMDTSELEVKIRDAKSAFIRAQQKYDGLINWNKSTEVSRANRSLTKTQASVDSAKRKLAESKNLFDKGIIPRMEYDSAKEQLSNLKLEFKSSQEELASVLNKGSEENVKVAVLELDNARVKLLSLESQIKRASVYAPVDGIVILPQVKEGQKAKAIEKGVSLTQGELIISVGNLEGLSVKSQVDEVDISKIKLGQRVKVSGDAFPDLSLAGKVAHVSSVASTSGFSQVPMFEVTVTIELLTTRQRKRLKLGMSSNLQVLVYDNPEALLVPIGSVNTDGAEHWVMVKDNQTREIKMVPVRTGLTTMDSVEILRGLKAGDEVLHGGSIAGQPGPSHGYP